MAILKTEKLCINFGGVMAVNNVTFSVEKGEHLAIIGPNGAGKTTLFNLLCGQLSPTSGKIIFNEKDITHLTIHQRTHLGINRSFQILSLFSNLRVIDNALLAVQGTLPNRFQMFKLVSRDKLMFAKAEALLNSMGLREKRNEPVSSISYGEQRKLEIALSLASEPKLLLLDEPNCGLTKAECVDITDRINKLGEYITVILVAHDMDLVFNVAKRIIVLYYGEVIAEGTPSQIKDNPRVKEVYTGIEEKRSNVRAS